MRSTFKNGAVLRCDMVTVSEDGTEHSNECKEKFVTYSIVAIVREQAAGAKWARVRVGLVKWPGEPPMENAKKVDLCPTHAKLVITPAEAKAARAKAKEEKKAARLAARAEAKAEKKRQKAAAREVAATVKEQRKARRGKVASVEA